MVVLSDGPHPTVKPGEQIYHSGPQKALRKLSYLPRVDKEEQVPRLALSPRSRMS